MSDLICKNTGYRCNTPGMCSPFGGCRETEPVSSVWLERLRSEFRQAVRDRDQLIAENEALRKDAERYRWLRRATPESNRIAMEENDDDMDLAIDAAMAKSK